jgi:hypothetical protein
MGNKGKYIIAHPDSGTGQYFGARIDIITHNLMIRKYFGFMEIIKNLSYRYLALHKCKKTQKIQLAVNL